MSKTITTGDLIAQVLPALKQTPAASAKEVGTTTIHMGVLVSEGFVKLAGTRKSTDENGKPRRGRPTHLFRLTKRGNDKVRRLAI